MRRGGAKPNYHTYGQLIKACLRPIHDTTEERQECLTLSFQMLDQMGEDELKPTLFIYNTALAVCVRNGGMVDVAHLRDEMRDRGIKPDIYTFGTLMAACQKHGNLPMADALLSDMARAKVEPNDRVYAALAKVYVGCRQVLRAKRLLSEMEDKGIRPLLETFFAVCFRVLGF